MTSVAPSNEHTIHESLYRPVLFAGVAPAILIIEVSTIFAVVFLVGLSITTVLLGVGYIAFVHPVAVWITAKDAQMPAVYLRAILSKDFYLPHAAPFASAPGVRASIPRTH